MILAMLEQSEMLEGFLWFVVVLIVVPMVVLMIRLLHKICGIREVSIVFDTMEDVQTDTLAGSQSESQPVQNNCGQFE